MPTSKGRELAISLGCCIYKLETTLYFTSFIFLVLWIENLRLRDTTKIMPIVSCRAGPELQYPNCSAWGVCRSRDAQMWTVLGKACDFTLQPQLIKRSTQNLTQYPKLSVGTCFLSCNVMFVHLKTRVNVPTGKPAVASEKLRLHPGWQNS